jgi:hypothetical protein
MEGAWKYEGICTAISIILSLSGHFGGADFWFNPNYVLEKY